MRAPAQCVLHMEPRVVGPQFLYTSVFATIRTQNTVKCMLETWPGKCTIVVCMPTKILQANFAEKICNSSVKLEDGCLDWILRQKKDC